MDFKAFSIISDPFTLGNKASQMAKDSYPSNKQHNKEGDALRHILWAAMLAKAHGPEYASAITGIHESKFIPFLGGMTQPWDEKAMDEYNNQLGMDIQYMTEEELLQKAKALVDQGKAKTLKRGGEY